jgi:hypothetical protein
MKWLMLRLRGDLAQSIAIPYFLNTSESLVSRVVRRFIIDALLARCSQRANFNSVTQDMRPSLHARSEEDVRARGLETA